MHLVCFKGVRMLEGQRFRVARCSPICSAISQTPSGKYFVPLFEEFTNLSIYSEKKMRGVRRKHQLCSYLERIDSDLNVQKWKPDLRPQSLGAGSLWRHVVLS